MYGENVSHHTRNRIPAIETDRVVIRRAKLDWTIGCTMLFNSLKKSQKTSEIYFASEIFILADTKFLCFFVIERRPDDIERQNTPKPYDFMYQNPDLMTKIGMVLFFNLLTNFLEKLISLHKKLIMATCDDLWSLLGNFAAKRQDFHSSEILSAIHSREAKNLNR